MIDVIDRKSQKRIDLTADYEELNKLQKLCAEDQAFLISSKKEKDKFGENRSTLESEVKRKTLYRAEVKGRKETIDKLHERAEKIKLYIDGCGKIAQASLIEIAKRKETAFADSIYLSALLHYFSYFPIQSRKQMRILVQNILKELNIPVYETDTKEDGKLVELYSLALDEIEDEPRWHAISADYFISSACVYELFFLLCYSENAILLLDNWGISSEIIKTVVASERDFSQIYCSKLCAYPLSAYKKNINQLMFVYDAKSSGLTYDSGLIQKTLCERHYNTKLLNEATTCLGITSKCKTIFVQPAVDQINKYKGSDFDIQLINGKLEEYEGHELWIGINQVFYKNLLPEIHEKWLEVISQWQEQMKIENELDQELIGIFKEINNIEDMSLEKMTKISEVVCQKKDPAEIFKEYQSITTQHPLLASYSNALSIVKHYKITKLAFWKFKKIFRIYWRNHLFMENVFKYVRPNCV